MARNVDSKLQEEKKVRERFEKLASKSIKVKGKYKPILQKDILNNAKSIERSYAKFTKFNTTNVDDLVTEDNAVDVGFSENYLDKNVLYPSDQDSTKGIKKMRKITSSSGGGGLGASLRGTSRIFNDAFTRQASLMTKLHAERMEATLKLQNAQIKHLHSASEHLQKINKFQATVQTEYYKNNLQTQHSILQELRDINKHLKAGFNLDDKGRPQDEIRSVDSIAKMIFGGNLRGNWKKIAAKVGQQLIDSKTGGMASLVLPMLMTYSQAGGANILGDAVRGVASHGASKLLGRRNYDKYSAWMNDPGTAFEAMMNNWQATGKGFKRTLGRALGTKRIRGNRGVDLTEYLIKDSDKRASFDQMAHTALTKVIPTALAKIQAAVTKMPELHYNYKYNRYETLKEADKALKSGYSPQTKRALKDIEKRMYGYTTRDYEGNKVFQKGFFTSLSEKKYDKVQNIDVVRALIKNRPREIGHAMMKIMLFYSQFDANVGAMLQHDDITVEKLIPILYPEAKRNPNMKWTDSMISSATAFVTFIETLRDLPKDHFSDIWDDILSLVENVKNLQHKDMSRAMEGYYSNAQFASYTGKMAKTASGSRTLTTEERRREYDPYEVSSVEDMLGVDPIDLSGVMTPEAVRKQIAERYNAVLQPLLKGSHDNIKRNIKNKIQEYRRKDPEHMFLKPLEKVLRALEKGGDIFADDPDRMYFSPDEAYNSFKKNKEVKVGPQLRTDSIRDTIESAKEVAKWHLTNSPRMRGIAGTASVAGYGLLVKTMAEKSGMSGPLSSSIIGTAAAMSLAMSGRITKMMDIIATDVGDEKMLRKDGSESNVTKREALNEAMYREMLPKAWGYNTGMKFGGWIKNNIRFGPILGPVIGLSTGFILAKTSGWIVKVAGLFGKMGKGLLNFAGRKITGQDNANWGDMLRDLVREKLGLAPIGADTFSVKEIMRQTGKQGKIKGTRWDNFAATFTGQTGDQIAQKRFNRQWREELEKKLNKRLLYAERSGDTATYDRIKNKLYSMEEAGDVSGMNKLESVISQGKKGAILEDELLGAINDIELEEKAKLERKSLKKDPWYNRVLQVRVVGGHLDALGTVGMIDGVAYQKNMLNMRKYTKINQASKKKPDEREMDHLKRSDTFLRQEKTAKLAVEQQIKEEAREIEQQKDIDSMAKSFDPENPNNLSSTLSKNNNKKEKKGFLETIGDFLSGGIGGMASKLLIPLLGVGLGYLLLGPEKMNKGLSMIGNILEPIAKGAINGTIGAVGTGLGMWVDSYSNGFSGGVSRLIDGSRALNAVSKGGFNKFRNNVIAKGLNARSAYKDLWKAKRGLSGVTKSGYKGAVNEDVLKKRIRDSGSYKFTIMDDLGKAKEKYLGKVDDVAAKFADDGIEGAAKLSKLDNVSKWLVKFMSKVDDILLKIPGFKKISTKIGSLGPGLLKIFKELLEEYGPKFLKEGMQKVAKSSVIGAVKGALTVSQVGIIINAGFVAWDAFQGAKKAKEYFGIADDDRPTFIQKMACAITFGVLSAIESVPGLFIITAIVSSLDFIMKHLCRAIYKLLNAALGVVGLGDSEEESMEMKILDAGLEHSKTEKEAHEKYEGYKAQVNKGEWFDGSHSFGGYYTSDGTFLETKGGSGGDGGTPVSPNKAISGRPEKGPVPSGFVSQNDFINAKLGSGNLRDDGCSLAVMKMISSFLNINIDDNTMINKARNHLLPDRSVSIEFFSEFGGSTTADKDEMKQALKTPGTAMAILTKGHFIAVLVKDSGHIWVGDPLKSGWEVMSSNTASITAHATACAIFSENMIVTGMRKPKGGRGSKKIGGFGTEAKPLNIKENSSSGKRKKGKTKYNISGSPSWVEKANAEYQNKLNTTSASASTGTTTSSSTGGDTGPEGTFTGQPVAGGLSFQASQVKNNGGWTWDSLPKTEGKGYSNLKPLIDALSSRFNIPADTITALMQLESGLNPSLPPNKYGYTGLGQFRRDSWKARINEGSYNGYQYGIKELGQGGDLYNARQSGTLYTVSMAHDAKQLEKRYGLKTVTAGHLHLGHLLPTTKDYYNNPNKRIIDMSGVTPEMIRANYPILAAGGRSGAGSATLQQALDQDNAFLAKKLTEGKGSSNKGGKGGKYKKYVERWGAGGGAVPNITLNTLQSIFFTENASGLKDLFKNPGSKVLCGIATIMNLARLGRVNSYKQDGKPKIWDVKKFVEKYKYFDKDKGIKSSIFINHFSGYEYPLELANTQGPAGSFGWLSQMTKGGKKSYKLQHGDVCVYLDITGHFRIIVGLGSGKYAIMNPSMSKVEVIGETFLETSNYTKVTWACYWTAPGTIRISNELLGSPAGSGTSGDTTGDTTNGASDTPTDGTTPPAGEETTASGSTTVEAEQQRGTSAKFGGYYFKDEKGELQQLTFKIHKDQQVSAPGLSTGTGVNPDGTPTNGQPMINGGDLKCIQAAAAEFKAYGGKDAPVSQVNRYSMGAGLGPKYDNRLWCAIFVSYCMRQQFPDYPSSPSSQHPYLDSKNFTKINGPRPGACVVWYQESLGGNGHIALVAEADEKGNFKAYGGNPAVSYRSYTAGNYDYRLRNGKPRKFGGFYLYKGFNGSTSSTTNKLAGVAGQTAGGDGGDKVGADGAYWVDKNEILNDTDEGANVLIEREEKTAKGLTSTNDNKDMKNFISQNKAIEGRVYQSNFDGARNLNTTQKDRIAMEAKMKMYNNIKGGFGATHDVGPLSVSYTREDVANRTGRTTAAVLKDNPNPLVALLGQLIDVTIDNRNTLHTIHKETAKQTKIQEKTEEVVNYTAKQSTKLKDLTENIKNGKYPVTQINMASKTEDKEIYFAQLEALSREWGMGVKDIKN